MNSEKDVQQMVDEMKRALDLSPQQIAFLMDMAYDPEMHEGEPKKPEPKGKKATGKDVEQMLRRR